MRYGPEGNMSVEQIWPTSCLESSEVTHKHTDISLNLIRIWLRSSTEVVFHSTFHHVSLWKVRLYDFRDIISSTSRRKVNRRENKSDFIYFFVKSTHTKIQHQSHFLININFEHLIQFLMVITHTEKKKSLKNILNIKISNYQKYRFQNICT